MGAELKKEISVDVVVKDKTAEGVEAIIKKTEKNIGINIPVNIDLNELKTELIGLKTLVNDITTVIGRNGQKIEQSFGKIEFKNFRQSISNIENILSRFNELIIVTKRDGKNVFNIRGISSIRNDLDSLDAVAKDVKKSLEGIGTSLQSIATMKGIDSKTGLPEIEKNAEEATERIITLREELQKIVSSGNFKKRKGSSDDIVGYFSEKETGHNIGYNISKKLLNGKKVVSEELKEFFNVIMRIYADANDNID